MGFIGLNRERKKGNTVTALWVEVEGKRIRIPLRRHVPVQLDDSLTLQITGQEIDDALGGNLLEVAWEMDDE